MSAVHPKKLLEKASSLEAKGALKEASHQYASLIPILRNRGKVVEALTLCDKAMELSPSSTRLHLTKALCLMDIKRTNEALVEMESFAKAALRQNRVSQYLELAEQRLSSQWELYCHFLKTLLEVERTRADIFLALGHGFLRQGEIKSSFEMVFAALHTSSEIDKGMSLLKEIILQKGREEDLLYFDHFVAKRWTLERIEKHILVENISLKPDLKLEALKEDSFEDKSTGHRNGSVLLKSLNEETSSVLKQLIRELETELGEMPIGIEPLSGLVAEFKLKATHVINGDSQACLDIAIAFKEMGLLNEAKEFLNKVTSEQEKYVAAQILKGEIEFDSGSFLSALDIFLQILRVDKMEENEMKEALYYAVRIYFQLQNFEKANQFAKKLGAIDSNYRNLKKIGAALKQKLEKR